MVQRLEKTEFFETVGFNSAADWNRLVTWIEGVLHEWKVCSQQYSPRSSFTRSESQPRHKFFKRNYKLSLTRHTSIGVSSCGIEKNSDLETVSSDDKDGTKAWLDMLDKSNMFPDNDAHLVEKCYGLKDFIVMSKSRGACERDMFMNALEKANQNTGCQIPLFVELNERNETYFDGFLTYNGLRTIFNMRIFRTSRS